MIKNMIIAEERGFTGPIFFSWVITLTFWAADSEE
jgi:hypothetical protein